MHHKPRPHCGSEYLLPSQRQFPYHHNKEIQESLEKVEREWENVNKTWSIIVIHEELDNIEEALVKAKSSINEGEREDRIRRNRNCNILYKTCERKRKNIIKKYFLNNETKQWLWSTNISTP